MIEITNERRYCNCCHGSDRVETITFWSNDKQGASGTSVALCRACRLSLRVEDVIMVNFGLNFAKWILGLAGEHDADRVLDVILGFFN